MTMAPKTGIPEIVVECWEGPNEDSSEEAPPSPIAAGSKYARKKIAVAPGHSMTHWMQKVMDERKKPPSYRIISLDELKKHNKKEDLWMVLRGKVFDVTDYVNYHPGGVPYLMRGAGKDATKMFNKIHNFVNFDNILQNRQVGLYIPEDPEPTPTSSSSLSHTSNSTAKKTENVPTSSKFDVTKSLHNEQLSEYFGRRSNNNFYYSYINNLLHEMRKTKLIFHVYTCLGTQPSEPWLALLISARRNSTVSGEVVLTFQNKETAFTNQNNCPSQAEELILKLIGPKKTPTSNNNVRRKSDRVVNTIHIFVEKQPKCLKSTTNCKYFSQYHMFKISSQCYPNLFYLYNNILIRPVCD